VWDELDALYSSMAAEQEAKVLSLARRLKAGLTAEDVRNPHDHRELDDPDFHYEDGMLAGLQFALSALRARRREREAAAAGRGTASAPEGGRDRG
jgi:hypothetical protein